MVIPGRAVPTANETAIPGTRDDMLLPHLLCALLGDMGRAYQEHLCGAVCHIEEFWSRGCWSETLAGTLEPRVPPPYSYLCACKAKHHLGIQESGTFRVGGAGGDMQQLEREDGKMALSCSAEKLCRCERTLAARGGSSGGQRIECRILAGKGRGGEEREESSLTGWGSNGRLHRWRGFAGISKCW